MKHLILVPMIAICSLVHGKCKPFKSHVPSGEKGIGVEFYRNIEFLGFVFFLGSMGPAYENDMELMSNGVTKQEWYAYNFSLYHQYISFKDDPDLRKTAVVAEGAEGSMLVRLMLQLDDFPNARVDGLEEQYYVGFSTKGDPADGLAIVTEFVTRLNNFYKTVNFDQYFKDKNKHYETALREVVRALPDDRLVVAMEKFFKKSFQSYTLIPSLTIPAGMAFGSRYTSADKTYIFNTFGPFARQRFTDDKQIDMGFSDKEHLRELSTHEFSHSFTNPVVDEIPLQMIKDTERLFTPVSEAMDNQGYPTWKTCVYEHFVRATEVVIARNIGRHQEADALLKAYMEDRKFIYLPVIIESLEKYNRNQDSMTFKAAVLEAMERMLRV